MANMIVSEISSFVLPSHRGLTHLEVVRDCVEKTQVLAALGIGCVSNLETRQCLQLLSMVDDWMALAQCQISNALNPHAEQAATKQLS